MYSPFDTSIIYLFSSDRWLDWVDQKRYFSPEFSYQRKIYAYWWVENAQYVSSIVWIISLFSRSLSMPALEFTDR